MQARGARGVIAALAGDNVVGVFARDVANQQRFEHALFADGIGKLADIADVSCGAGRDSGESCRWGSCGPMDAPLITGQRLDVVRVMPHLESDG